MFDITFELINGLKLGVEHVSAEGLDLGDGEQWLIAVDLPILRVGIVYYANE